MNEIVLNYGKNRFQFVINENVSYIEFVKIEPNILDFQHTIVPNELSGKGIGSKLLLGALEYCKFHHLKIIPSCPFVSNFIAKNKKWSALTVQAKL